MTSTERREKRYQRRKLARAMKRQENSDTVGSITQAFSYHDMFMYAKKCCNGVRWKQSTQNFERHLFSGTAKRRWQILNEKWKPSKYVHFTLTERGKTRPIDAPHINDRQIHKTLCNNVLVPLYSPSMIYDNGASQRGKGLHFHFKRLKEQLRWHYRRYGTQGAVFLMDFHHFFPLAPHDKIYERHKKFILNDDIRAVSDAIIASMPGGVGMPLGVEPSQEEMAALPSALDNYIKCQLGIHSAGHYMDDYYIILESHEQAEKTAKDIIKKAEALGFSINPKKCKIIDLNKPFKFCKAKFRMKDTGKIIVNGNRDSAKRARHKLKTLKKKVDCGEMSEKEVNEWLKSQLAYFEGYNDHGRILRLQRLYHAIYKRN